MPLRFKLLISALLLGSIGLPRPLFVYGATSDVLQSQIDDRNQQIKQLEQEINGLRNNLADTAKRGTTLKSEVDRLKSISQQLAAQIKLTQAKVDQTSLVIKGLERNISGKQDDIAATQDSLREILRELEIRGDESLPEIMLGSGSLASVWAERERFAQLGDHLYQLVGQLRQDKQHLETNKQAVEQQKAKQLSLKAELADQKKINDQNQKDEADLLAQTKSQEANYTRLIADRLARKNAAEQEVAAFEAQLHLAVDLSKLPGAGSKPLHWPLDDVFITQQFGVTSDSKRLYATGSHNGVDFRAAIGTPVKAAADGVVLGTGNTDLVCRGASYGQWVLVRHNNGLTTLYGHLSLIKVQRGQAVSLGSLIGYSGQTGYATGPHLHLSVFASDGVEIQSLKSRVCRGTYTIPVADQRAYLDPLLYLG